MITARTQRWRDRRGTYRPAGEVIRTAEYEIAEIDEDKVAKAFVLQHHYSASYPAARWRFGLYRAGQLVGVSVFSHPTNDRALACFPGAARESTELGRLVLLDDVPGNGESWFVARCYEQLRREGLIGVLSMSDPTARVLADGSVVHPGHVGTIYQALNACYLGRATARTLRLLPDGRVLSGRAMSKIRKRDKGWRYSSALLEAHGAAPLGEAEDAAEWLALWLPRLTRPLRHPGNHRYAWMLQRAQRRHLPASQPYPKLPTTTDAGDAGGKAT